MKKIIFILLGFVIFLGIYWKIHREAYRGVMAENNKENVEFTIEPGEGSTEVGEKLAQAGLIKSKYYFWYYVWRTGSDSKLQAGRYLLSAGLTIPEMVHKFLQGEVKEEIVRLTVPEGYTNDQIIELLKEKKPELVNEFQQIVKCRCRNNAVKNDKQKKCSCDYFSDRYKFLQEIPTGQDLEGYLFPDTYFLAQEETGKSLVNKFLTNFTRKVDNNLQKAAQEKTGSLFQVITLASIVEREVNKPEERPIVAGIFWKRIKKGMPLQSDATLSYVLKTNKIKYDAKDLATNSPYNTYQNFGLPPGPIANPGLEAIKAVIYPQESEYWYFLNDAQTGETVFSKTHQEHLRNKAQHGL